SRFLHWSSRRSVPAARASRGSTIRSSRTCSASCPNAMTFKRLAMADRAAPDLILHNGVFTTLDRARPAASAVAIRDGRFLQVGDAAEIMPLAGPATKVIDLRGRRVIPGLCDNHTHIIRGGLNYNMELRWDGVRSLADAMSMLKRQVAVTPAPQWVRVVGGF